MKKRLRRQMTAATTLTTILNNFFTADDFRRIAYNNDIEIAALNVWKSKYICLHKRIKRKFQCRLQ